MISLFDYAGDCFSLFQIFGNKPEKKSAQKPLEQSSDVSAQAVGNTITNQGNVKCNVCLQLLYSSYK